MYAESFRVSTLPLQKRRRSLKRDCLHPMDSLPPLLRARGRRSSCPSALVENRRCPLRLRFRHADARRVDHKGIGIPALLADFNRGPKCQRMLGRRLFLEGLDSFLVLRGFSTANVGLFSVIRSSHSCELLPPPCGSCPMFWRAPNPAGARLSQSRILASPIHHLQRQHQ